MKLLLLMIAMCSLISTECLATIIPGQLPVQSVFGKADLVCKCAVVSAEASAGQSRDAVGNYRAGTRIRLKVIAEDVYKGNVQNGQTATLDYVADPLAGVPPRNGQTLLVFASRNADGTYVLADPLVGATAFSTLPQQTEEPSLVKLESALVGAAQQQNRNDSLQALSLLRGFDELNVSFLPSLRGLTMSPDREVVAGALAVLLKTKTPQSVAEVRSFLDNVLDENESPIVISIGTELGDVNDNRARADIEALTTSRFVSVRIGALNALRKMKDQRSAAILIQRLDDRDSFVRYLAVITLAEMFGKNGEFAPSAPIFDGNPNFYTNLWKTWWVQQGK